MAMATTLATPQKVQGVTNRNSTLDGWRGVAILMVLIDHLDEGLFHHRFLWLEKGQHGVTIFFVLSGFLITSKLLEPKHSLRAFYTRRFFRLMPAAWFYLAFLVLVVPLINGPVVSARELASCLFFYRNYFGTGMETPHYWSLSVEEQFYLVWPCVLFFLGHRKGAWLAAAGAACCAVYRFFHWSLYDGVRWEFHTEARVDALLIGCLLALAIQNDDFRALVGRWGRRYTTPLLLTVAICVVRFQGLPPLFESVSIALLIAAALEPESLLSRALSLKWLRWLGLISYSVYLWQEFFMGLVGVRGFFVALLGLPLMVFISYYYVEQPCIRLGRSLETSQPHPTNAYATWPPLGAKMLMENVGETQRCRCSSQAE